MSKYEFRMLDQRDILAVEREARRMRSELMANFFRAAFRRGGVAIGRLVNGRGRPGAATRA
jgi:hypothetical protein